MSLPKAFFQDYFNSIIAFEKLTPNANGLHLLRSLLSKFDQVGELEPNFNLRDMLDKMPTGFVINIGRLTHHGPQLEIETVMTLRPSASCISDKEFVIMFYRCSMNYFICLLVDS